MDSFPEVERYTAFLNPYPDHRFTRCPRCAGKTQERNRALVVEVGANIVVPAMLTCRYCANCDLLIAHQDQLEATLRQIIPPEEHASIEQSLAIVGTLDRSRLPRGDLEEMTPADALEAFRPIRELVRFDRVQNEAGNVEFVEVAVPHREIVPQIPVPPEAEVERLPQVEEMWQLAVVKMWTWITGEEGEPYRPYLVLIVSSAGPVMLYQEMLETAPSTTQIRDGLLRAMSHPAPGAGKPRRPTVVVTDSEELASAIAPEIASLDIQVTTGETPDLDELLVELESFLAGGQEPIPGLLDDLRVTPEQVGDLFHAAAEFYREEPWEWMLDEDLIAVRYPATKGQWRFASVMGYAGMEFGLAVFDDLGDYDRLATVLPEDAFGMMNYRSLTFDEITAMPFSDLDALEHYGWQVAADDAYPIPITFTQDEEVIRPGPEEIEWYTVALRAIVTFFQDYWPDDIDFVPEDVSTTLTVPLVGRRVRVDLRYPAELALGPT